MKIAVRSLQGAVGSTKLRKGFIWLLHEETLRQQYISLIETFHAEFPGIDPPTPDWWMLWLDKYSFGDLMAVIQSLGKHPLKAKFTEQSTGKKAIAA